MAESLTTSADATTKDKRPNSGSSEGKENNIDDMAEWERRLVEGDLPDDFLEVTEPSGQKKPEEVTPPSDATTGLLIDIPTVTSSNSVLPQDHVPPPKSLQGRTVHYCMETLTEFMVSFIVIQTDLKKMKL